MGTFKDLTGQKFNKLTILKRAEDEIQPSGNNRIMWLCRCDCGNLITLRTDMLTSGNTKSCGCIKLKYKKQRDFHNKTNTRLYHKWGDIIQRCYNKNNTSYNNYGGRGITICNEWKDSFLNFYNWSINNGYKDELTIDRINVNGNYTPENCRWVSKKEQQRNKRNNCLINYKGEIHTLVEWSEIVGIKTTTLWSRLFRSKWTVNKALTYRIPKSWK